MTSLGRDLKTGRFWRHFFGATFAAFGVLAALAGLVDVLFPDALKHRGVCGTIAIVLLSVGSGLWRAWPRPIEQKYSKPDTKICVVRGDLLDEAGHLVIGTCDTFDTEPPHIIAKTSLQAKALDRLFAGDRAQLDKLIEAELSGVDSVGTVDKAGKTDRYEIGTVAALPYQTRRLFFVAYTMMDEENRAQGTADGIWKSLISLWNSISIYSNGEPVAIPVIGGGQSRISQILPAQDSIRFIALSFMLQGRGSKVCDELRIVVQPDIYDGLDRLEIQAFLSSLAES